MPRASAADWLEAAELLAKASRQPNETEAQAFARVTAKGPGAAFLEMARQPQGRMPARVNVVYKGQQAQTAEAKLHAQAVEAAATSGQSYEQEMARILATPDGQQLWQQARNEAPSVQCPD